MLNSAHLFLIYRLFLVDGLIYLSREAKSRYQRQTAEIKKRSPMLRLFVVPLLNRETRFFSLYMSTVY